MIKKIVTHPGGAHKDDFLATCVLISKYGAPIERRNPTPSEVTDASVALVDIGGSDDAQLSNFDHHQYPREHAPTCALSLVLQHFGLYDDALAVCDWLETAEWFDSRGPHQTANWLGVPREAVARLNSPIDISLLRRFAGQAELSSPQPLYEVMRYIGDDLREHIEGSKRRFEQIKNQMVIWDLNLDAQPNQALFLERSETLPDEPSALLGRYARSLSQGSSVLALVYPDRRGEGYGITRFEDHPRLDFSRVEQEHDVHFAHTSGFMCKTSATSPDRLRELIGLSFR